MSSIADSLRRRTAAQVLAMSAAERVRLALALGDEDLERFVQASGLTVHESLRRLRASRQRGRTPSACAAMD